MDRWWQVVVPDGATQVDLPGDAQGRNSLATRLQALEPGSVVAVVDEQQASWWHLRRFLRRNGLRLEREYVALPGLGGPGYLVQADHATFRHFFSHLLFVPGGAWMRVAATRVLGRAASTSGLWRVGAGLCASRLAIARKA